MGRSDASAFARIVFCLFAFPHSFEAGAFDLVSNAEVIASQSAKAYDATAGEIPSQGPVIEINQSILSLDRPVRNPLSIEVSFRAQHGAAIDFSSFRAYYGNLRLDITDRLLKHLVRTASGFQLNNVSLPKGSHKLILAIKDDKAREGKKSVSLTVE
jgi:hypothetical protein